MYETEIKVYELNRNKWCSQGLDGHYVVIRGEDIVGTYSTEREAFISGTAASKDGVFLLRRIKLIDQQEMLPLIVLESVPPE